MAVWRGEGEGEGEKRRVKGGGGGENTSHHHPASPSLFASLSSLSSLFSLFLPSLTVLLVPQPGRNAGGGRIHASIDGKGLGGGRAVRGRGRQAGGAGVFEQAGAKPKYPAQGAARRAGGQAVEGAGHLEGPGRVVIHDQVGGGGGVGVRGGGLKKGGGERG